MAKTILTSIHGRRVGLSADGQLVVRGRTVPSVNDTGSLQKVQPAPVAVNATATLLAAEILSGLITSSTAAAVNATLPAGTLLDAAVTDPACPIDAGFTWGVINTGPNTFTILVGATHTIVGSAAVATGVSAQFFTRKTAANTFVTYRVA